MKSDLAPQLPTARPNWAWDRRAELRAERAKRTTREILGGLVFEKVTGEKPILGAVLNSDLKQVILLKDTTSEPRKIYSLADLA